MPVHKYRTFEEAERALWDFHPDAAYYDRVAELWRFADELCPITYPRGIFKYRSLEEANRQRYEWELAHARKMAINTKPGGTKPSEADKELGM